MLSLRILSLRKNTDPAITEIEATYLRRLKPVCNLLVEDVRTTYEENRPVSGILEKEAEIIEKKLTPSDVLAALDENGRQHSSREFAVWLCGPNAPATKRITFLIGGPYGIHERLLRRASLRLSLSRMTLTHEHARVILLEQIYRAFDIARGGKYHK